MIGAGVAGKFVEGSYIARGIMAGVDGALSFTSYCIQSGMNGQNISLGGSLISLGSGLFNFCDPLNKVFDAITAPILGAEIAWAYDVISNARKQKKLIASY